MSELPQPVSFARMGFRSFAQIPEMVDKGGAGLRRALGQHDEDAGNLQHLGLADHRRLRAEIIDPDLLVGRNIRNGVSTPRASETPDGVRRSQLRG